MFFQIVNGKKEDITANQKEEILCAMVANNHGTIYM